MLSALSRYTTGSMNESYASGVTVTFTPIYKDKFLFVQRHKNDDVLPGYWCFPGGKVHVGETLAVAMERECKEETGLAATGRAFFVDSYLLGKRVGVHFGLEVENDKVSLTDLDDYVWVTHEDELEQYLPRIPGINNHLYYTFQHLQLLRSLDVRLKELKVSDIERRKFERLAWQPLEQFDLVEERFRNK